jgi:homopolymeric O-antigen transport system permease protein
VDEGTDGGSASAPQRPKATVVIVPGSTPLRQYGRDLLQHRDLIRVLAVRDITLRYRQTALGAIWVVLQPLLAAGLLSFVFGQIADLPTDGIPAFLFTYAGLLAWNAFSATLNRSTTSLTGSIALVSKIFFPRMVLPLAGTLSVLVDFCVSLCIVLVMMIARGFPPGAAIALLPVWLLFFLMLAQGIGSFIASIAVRYRDFGYITPFLVQLGLYASPVAYSVSAVPEKYLDLYYLNPVVGLLEAFRWSLFETPFPTAIHLAYSIVVTCIVFAVGLLTFQRRERFFADVI